MRKAPWVLLCAVCGGCAGESIRPTAVEPGRVERLARLDQAHPARKSFGLVVTEGAGPYVSDPFEPFDVLPPPVPPKDVVCTIVGKNAPYDNECDQEEGRSIVSSDLSGDHPLASFDTSSAEMTWGVREGKPDRMWIDARADGFILTGYTNGAKEIFLLKRDVPIVAGHVTLMESAPVTIRSGSKDGVAVRVHDELDGVDALDPTVPCDALLYDWPETTTIAPEIPAPGAEVVHPVGTVLTVYAAPGGAALTTLKGPQDKFGLDLGVVEQWPEWTRVQFLTRGARFDVWVKNGEVASNGPTGLGMGGLGCGRSGGMSGGPTTQTIESARVVVGKTPARRSKGPNGLVILSNTTVKVGKTVGDYVEITVPYGSIRPPPNASFWIPKTALAE